MAKIKRVDPVSLAYPEPNDNGATRYLTLCRIESTDGTVGWGEAVTMWPDVCRATEDLIEGFAEIVVGSDSESNVATWNDLRTRSWWYGHGGGLASFAISAIDIALWDLRGKETGTSLIGLLGGQRSGQLPAIASTHAFLPDLHAEVERHGKYVTDGGYRGFKIGFGKRGDARLGYEFDRDVAFVRMAREAAGPEAMIMIDRGQNLRWDLHHAIRLTNAMEQHDLTWMEEPFEPHELESFRRFRSRVSTMVGTGEREWQELGFRRVIESGVVDVVGCDPGRSEGITGSLRVIRLVEQCGLWFNAHAWSSAIVTAASLALSASTDRCLVFEYKPIENPMQHELVNEPLTPVEGFASVPTRPGLGIEIDESVLEKYRLA
jgi:L-alanine-DL-glutamate epimerase-like enolase superfamily enzyme